MDEPKRKRGRPKKDEPYTSASINVDVADLRRFRWVAEKHGFTSFSEFTRHAWRLSEQRLCGEDQKCA